MEYEIGVSISCTVFNHSKYLRECLDGFVNQKTNFKYEVLIHDDASTDDSQAIIQEYEEKYPDIIKPIYQTENQWSKKVKLNKMYQMPRVRGKYLAVCEGDDFWCDENKLQRQYDIMEANPNCHLCLHAVQTVNEDSSLADIVIPAFKFETGIIERNDFVKLAIAKEAPFQTTSYFRRTKDVMEYVYNPPKFEEVVDVGDVPILLYFGSLGDVYYDANIYSCYRRMSAGGWTETISKDKNKVYKHYLSMIEMYRAFNDFTSQEFNQEINEAIRRCEMVNKTMFLTPKEKAKLLLKRENAWYRDAIGKKKAWFYILDAYVPFVKKWYFSIKRSIKKVMR